MVTVVPVLIWLLMVMVPLCARMMCLTMDSPSPVPPSFRERDLSAT